MKQRKQGNLKNEDWTKPSFSSLDENGEKKDDESSWFSKDRNVFVFCVAFRVFNSLLVQTYFAPDEHWQCLEVAHRMVFGYGHLTWEWEKGIRSYLHPMIFAVLYKILAVLGLDTVLLMSKAPRLLQAVFAACGDLYLYKLSISLFGKHVSKWALFCQLTNWFMFFSITRTLSNSIETVLTTVAIFYWPLSGKAPMFTSCRILALYLAAFSCAMRTTSGIIWLYLGFLHFWETRDRLKFLFLEVIPIGFLVLLATCVLDYWMYGKWVIVPMNFIKFNFFSAGGDYYGTHPWHWYFSQGFPTIAFTFLPLSVAGVWLSKEWQLSGLIAWVLALYSLIGHKEFRFVMPILPITLLFSGYSLAKIDLAAFEARVPGKLNSVQFHRWKYLIVLALLVSNIPTALYTSLLHQRGSEAVMFYLAKEAENHQVESVIFLTQCHATPYYSQLHQNISMRFLDCTPRDELVSNQSKDQYQDESDRFFKDPVGFASHIFSSERLPTHVVLFDSEAAQLKEVLASYGYVMVKKIFHSHFPVDRHLQGYVLVYRKAY